MQPLMEEADTRRQRPRVSEDIPYERRIAALESQVQVMAQGIAGYERRIAALEGRVQQISAQTDVVVAAPQTEAERLLSAVLADIARLSAHRVVDGAAPELEAERLLCRTVRRCNRAVAACHSVGAFALTCTLGVDFHVCQRRHCQESECSYRVGTGGDALGLPPLSRSVGLLPLELSHSI